LINDFLDLPVDGMFYDLAISYDHAPGTAGIQYKPSHSELIASMILLTRQWFV
jgi:hypothetical protein